MDDVKSLTETAQ